MNIEKLDYLAGKITKSKNAKLYATLIFPSILVFQIILLKFTGGIGMLVFLLILIAFGVLALKQSKKEEDLK
jgi:hypothetical protein